MRVSNNWDIEIVSISGVRFNFIWTVTWRARLILSVIKCVFTFPAANVCFFLFLPRRYDPVWTRKAKVPELDYVPVFTSRTSETMHNMSTHQLSRYYQSKQIPFKDWTASVTWCTRRKIARTSKILQNFWLNLEYYFLWILFSSFEKNALKQKM